MAVEVNISMIDDRTNSTQILSQTIRLVIFEFKEIQSYGSQNLSRTDYGKKAKKLYPQITQRRIFYCLTENNEKIVTGNLSSESRKQNAPDGK